MTKILTIAAQNAPKAVGPYSQARKAVEVPFCSYYSTFVRNKQEEFHGCLLVFHLL